MSALKYIQIKDVLAKYLHIGIQLDPLLVEELNKDNILLAYFKLTQMNQMAANLTRRWFFPEIRHLISLSGTGRRTKWKAAFQKEDLIEWWSTNQEEVQKQLLTRLSACIGLPPDVPGINISKYQKSDEPMVKGTLLHEIYHQSICYSCIDAFEWDNCNEKKVSVIKGGRMLSNILPYVACTPDALVIKDLDMFWKNLKDPKSVDDTNNVLMTLELKTKFTGHVTLEEHERALKDPKEGLQIFTEKLYQMKLLFNENTLEDFDNLEMKITNIRRKSKNQPRSYAFLTKKYPFMRSDHFQAMCKSRRTHQKRKVTSNVLPNFVLDEITNRLQGETDECNLSDLVKNGRACLMIFNQETKEITEYRMEKAPFILTLNCQFFNQVLEQKVVSFSYSTNNKAIFALGICLEGGLKNVQEPQMSMVYWYDTGITDEAIKRVSHVIDREIFLVSKNVSSMKGLFDLDERKSYLPNKITCQDLFGDISDIDDDDESDDDDDDDESAFKSIRSDPYKVGVRKKKSIIIYECKSHPNIDWDRLQHLQPISQGSSAKRSHSFAESPCKSAAPSIIDTIASNNQSLSQVADEHTAIETPSLEYDKELIFGSDCF